MGSNVVFRGGRYSAEKSEGHVSDFVPAVVDDERVTARVASAFTPVLVKNEGGVFAVLISVQAWINLSGGYSVAQAALWSVTNALRTELAYANVHVLAGMVGLALSDETGNPAHPATDPASVAESLLAAIDAREYEVVFDAYTASVKQRLAGRIEQMYPELR
jgi:NAD(P)-dependent dehydrogenase (short-subunit alcohol dehydrogenase family)